jgi:hypothetical protein
MGFAVALAIRGDPISAGAVLRTVALQAWEAWQLAGLAVLTSNVG